MDYTQHAYFTGAPQSYFMGIPPLTPGHSTSVASDDYNTTSPPDGFDQQFANDQFQNFDYSQFAGNHQLAPFAGSSSPPSNGIVRPQQQQRQRQQRQQQPPPPPQQQQPQQQQPQQQQHDTHRPGLNGTETGGVNGHSSESLLSKPESSAEQQKNGSNSDDDDLTPAQSRRKAQNRAAQRAFRERKERHVKDLEAKLATLEATQHETASENERLKRDLQKMSTENEILRATSSLQRNDSLSPGDTTTGPTSYKPTDFYTDVLSNHANKTPSHRIVTSADGERLLAAGATWDFIVSHDLYRRGLVDVTAVSERLKHRAKCDGQGPVFEERAILEAIEESVASGSDELL